MTFNFLMSVPEGGAVSKYVDLSQCASLLNRRFYRQGLQWQVAGFKVFTSDNSGGQFGIMKVPNTWVTSNAWEKSFHAWQRMNNDALEEAESVKPKFLDFKVFMDADHHAAGPANNLIPGQTTVLTQGTWDMSSILIPDTSAPGTVADRELVWLGPNYPGAGASGLNAVSLIEGYAASRGLPDILDPNTPADAGDADGISPENWMSALFNDGTTQDDRVLQDMIQENNQAPYPFENDGVHVDTMYPGGANQGPGPIVHDITSFNTTTVSETNYLKGGLFNGGLIKFETVGMSQGATIQILVDLVPGPHRGYMARSMQDV